MTATGKCRTGKRPRSEACKKTQLATVGSCSEAGIKLTPTVRKVARVFW
nr:MAG TPA: hypothetical protein [Caudoviricetes sp.]